MMSEKENPVAQPAGDEFKRFRLPPLTRETWLLLLTAVIFAAFSIRYNITFLSAANCSAILRNLAFEGMLAIGPRGHRLFIAHCDGQRDRRRGRGVAGDHGGDFGRREFGGRPGDDSRRDDRRLLHGAGLPGSLTTCEKPNERGATSAVGGKAVDPNEEYVWLSANANLPLFTAHDHPALRLIGEELGVKVTVAGPNSVDIPALVAAVEQTTARRPAGMMVVGWDASALVPPINQAVESGIERLPEFRLPSR